MTEAAAAAAPRDDRLLPPSQDGRTLLCMGLISRFLFWPCSSPPIGIQDAR